MRFPLTGIAVLAMILAPAGAPGAGSSNTGPVAEIVTFRQAPGTDDAALLAAARGTEDFVRSAPGFLARTLSRAPDGTWTDYVLWADMAAAEAAGKALMKDPSAGAFLQAIDPQSVTLRHETVQWQMRR